MKLKKRMVQSPEKTIHLEVDELNKTIGARLMRLRSTYSLDQKTVAENIIVSANMVSQIENGVRGTDARKTIAFAKLYNVTTDFILTGNRESLSKVQATMIKGSRYFD